MRLKSEELNLDDNAVDSWMALHNLLWRLNIMNQFYETSIALRGLTRLQNRMDNVD